MKYIIALVLVITIIPNCFAFKLTDEQFENLEAIDYDLKQKYPQFKGFNGSQESMNTVGMNSQVIAQEIANMNLKQIIDNYPQNKQKENCKKKLKALGLTDEDLKTLNLK